MEFIGYILLASLFIFAAYGHLKNSDAMVGYTAQSLGACPVSPYISWLGGWPTGAYLALTGVLVAFQNDLGLWLAGGFLILATAIFHRNLNDPSTWKQVALIGAILALLAN